MSDKFSFNRRQVVAMGTTMTAGALAGCVAEGGGVQQVALGYKPVPQLGTPNNEAFPVPAVDMRKIPTQFHRQYVRHNQKYKKNTIIVDTENRYMYFIEDDDQAIRYGIGVGRAGFAWGGSATIRRKAKWPRWTPPSSMIRRQPELEKWRNGMPGGPENPLGARALYLYKGGRDTLYRLHGTNEPFSIGKAMSSGCIRMLNRDAIDLYERVKIGARVVVDQRGGASV